MGEKLSEKALLVRLSISQWVARRIDKTVTREVAVQHGNREDMGRYTKCLVDSKAIKTVAQVANSARSEHYHMTLPWSDDGWRIVTSAAYPEYMRTMRQLKAQFEDAVDDLVGSYPELIERAKNDLGNLFHPADYPAQESLTDKYNFGLTVMPLPEATDFRVSLQADEMERVRQEYSGTLSSNVATAMSDAWRRLYDVVAAVAERLSQPSNVFRDSLLGNVSRLVDILPKLNIAGDTELDRLAQEVREKLLQHEPQVLRDDLDKRAEIARAADAIMATMKDYM